LQRLAVVPPELIFDAGFGELFIVRVAGNVLSAGNRWEHAIRGAAPAHLAVRGARATRSAARWAQPSTPAFTGNNGSIPGFSSRRFHPAGPGRSRFAAHPGRRLPRKAIEAKRALDHCARSSTHPEGRERQAEGSLKLVARSTISKRAGCGFLE
jgi:hypothetical protein